MILINVNRSDKLNEKESYLERSKRTDTIQSKGIHTVRPLSHDDNTLEVSCIWASGVVLTNHRHDMLMFGNLVAVVVESRQGAGWA